MSGSLARPLLMSAATSPMTLDANDLDTILRDALPVARAAAKVLADRWRGTPEVRSKSRSDLVTDADLASESLIREQLTARFPSHAIVGEEGGGEGGALAWFVDPLDGTTNFAHGHPFFCVSMALVHEGEPVVGIVIAPALSLEWSATRGGGVTRNGARCQVSQTTLLDDALLSTGFPSWRASRGDNNYRAFLALDAATHGVRRCGASAIEIAMVADGSYDAFWDLGLKPWDVGASTLFVREAGGLVTDFDGSPVALDAGRILASNGRLHARLSRALAGDVSLPPIDGVEHRAGPHLRRPGEVG
ncbi:inositol monophosphatase family protein [Sandaracinus amylolyticus]|uniref:inositol monophosphatase family protein n=1 Tax=Sandaracinus amylolyticus TaxID=927083 RepID=UPI0012EE7BAD|nr:inositol monophosphatase family protein [Sandaracinus amylolyticus]